MDLHVYKRDVIYEIDLAMDVIERNKDKQAVRLFYEGWKSCAIEVLKDCEVTDGLVCLSGDDYIEWLENIEKEIAGMKPNIKKCFMLGCREFIKKIIKGGDIFDDLNHDEIG